MWIKDNHAVAVNLDVAARMQTVFRKSTVLGDHWTVEVSMLLTNVMPKTHDIGRFDTEFDARAWIDAFVTEYGIGSP